MIHTTHPSHSHTKISNSKKKHQSQPTKKITSENLIIKILFFIQTIIKIKNNFYLLYHYLFFYVTKYKLKSTNLILTHLTITNLSIILSKKIFQTILTFKLKNFLNNIKYKLIFYINKINKNISLTPPTS